MKRRLFGTDGIRGTYGQDPITRSTVQRIGRGLSAFLQRQHHDKPVTVVVGRDTRASGEELQQAICEGLADDAIHVLCLGVVPSPAVSMAVRDLHADLGVMITASHNPASDNGIKLFDPRGMKFGDEAEGQIEKLIFEQPEVKTHRKMNPEWVAYDHEFGSHYLNQMRSMLHQNDLKGWKIVVDTAHGAACQTTPAVLRHFGAELIVLGDHPNGENINAGVGSEYPDNLRRAVLAEGACLGIAHDGDADRALFCDETGRILTGEEYMGLISLDMLRRGTLADKTLVTTVQSNVGLDLTLAAAGGKVRRTEIGDRHVSEVMAAEGFTFGGESSGHYLFFEHGVAGDGLMAVIRLLEYLKRSGQPLSKLRREIRLLPQQTLNLTVAKKPSLQRCPNLRNAIRVTEETLGSGGRVMVRYSGTEPKLRLLVEADSESRIAACMDSLQAAARKDLEVVENQGVRRVPEPKIRTKPQKQGLR